MGTEILHPQDYLTERLRVGPEIRPHWRSHNAGNSYNPKSHRRTTVRPEPKKRGSQAERSVKNSNLVLGQVAILKRGEPLDLKRKNEALVKKTSDSAGYLVVCGSEPVGPDPVTVPKQIRVTDQRSAPADDVYAGSAFFLSPSPRALPLPSFSKKKQSVGSVDDSATKDLRRLLRLD